MVGVESPARSAVFAVDGHEVTDLVFRVTGSMRLHSDDDVHRRFMESLLLGGANEPTVYTMVVRKGATFKAGRDGQGIVTHTATARMESVEMPD